MQNDPKKFITSVSGTNSNFTTEGIAEQIRNFIITRFTDAVAESKIPVLNMAANLNEYSEKIQEIIKPSADGYGLDLTQFLVENISLPEAVQEALDRRSSIGSIGKENMSAYTQMQFADSLGKEGSAGIAGDAMRMGMGFAMAGQMAQAFSQPSAQQPPQAAMGGMGGAATNAGRSTFVLCSCEWAASGPLHHDAATGVCAARAAPARHPRVDQRHAPVGCCKERSRVATSLCAEHSAYHSG